MDAAALLTRARRLAAMSKAELARRAGTSRAALCAYESGRRSPSVATLTRLLAACDLQVPATLEPLLADVDALVDGLLTGPGRLPWGFSELTAALIDGGCTWAVDGLTAMALHGLTSDDVSVWVTAVDTERLRWTLRSLSARPVGLDGFPLFDSWLDLDLAAVSPRPMDTVRGFLRLRPTSTPPHALLVTPPGCPIPVPVLPLLDVEAAHPSLAAVLARLRKRRDVAVVRSQA